MKKLYGGIIFACFLFYGLQAQAISRCQLDKLCADIDREFVAEIEGKNDSLLNKNMRLTSDRSWFIVYLQKAYGKEQPVKYTISNTKYGKLERIGEGSYQIVENDLGAYPNMMLEKVYYFLNGELVKATLNQGSLDYNSIPAFFYAINIFTWELFYKDDECIKKIPYWTSRGKRYKVNQETARFWNMGTNEVELKTSAYNLLKKQTEVQ